MNHEPVDELTRRVQSVRTSKLFEMRLVEKEEKRARPKLGRRARRLGLLVGIAWRLITDAIDGKLRDRLSSDRQREIRCAQRVDDVWWTIDRDVDLNESRLDLLFEGGRDGSARGIVRRFRGA